MPDLHYKNYQLNAYWTHLRFATGIQMGPILAAHMEPKISLNMVLLPQIKYITKQFNSNSI